MTSSSLLALVLLVLIVLLLWLQRRFSLLPYLYLARYSLLTALVLLGCAPVALFVAADLLANLFVLSNWWELALVTWFALLAAWVCMTTLRLLLASGPYFFHNMQPLPLPTWPEGRIVFLFALFAVPIVAAALWRSSALGLLDKGIGVGLGVGIAVGARRLSERGLARLPRQPWLIALRSRLLALLEKAGYPTARNAAGQRVTANGHEVALAYLLFTLLVYVLGYFLLRPDQPWIDNLQVPALVYILLLFILLGWLLPGLALYLDRYRVPTSLALFLLSFLSWAFVNTDYYYAVKSSPALEQAQRAEPLTPEKAFRRWHARHPVDEYPIMVVVNTSGGGIKAAYWTAQVLTLLQREVGDAFSSSIVLISAASGGSVGAMYFVDAYADQGPPPSDQLTAIQAAASSPSLAPTAWGIIYPDFWRATFAIAGYWNPLQDRGWALEQAWAKKLATPERTFVDWRDGIAAGWRPPVIFNTTIVETGERLLLTPLDQNAPPITDEQIFSRPRYFSTLYPGFDIPVVTAARLSATFPYVTPVARALDTPAAQDYHLADGGYYDNFGFVSALEWLNTILPHAQTLGRKKLLLLQIEASAFSEEGLPPPNENAGWLYNLAGPVLTMLNVQTTAQQQRNNMEYQIFTRAYARDIEIKRVKFQFGGEAPLSWQLAPEDKVRIEQELSSMENRRSLATIQRYFAGDE
ncbi:MAG: patatin-like phospholipase family protein [Caldilineaceae bacterium]|nr:patatin-like phospholipase family protein [Caldilineaceae bacterium]